MNNSEKPAVIQTYTNKYRYMDENGIYGKIRSTLMMVTDKTVLMVSKPSEKAVAEKFCEKFGINCTVRVSESGITGNSITCVIVDEFANDGVSQKQKINEHFNRMMSRFLK